MKDKIINGLYNSSFNWFYGSYTIIITNLILIKEYNYLLI